MIARHWALMVLASALVASGGAAQEVRPLIADAFPVGAARGALCEAQSQVDDPVLDRPLDRAWLILCRDAGAPIGQLVALRRDGAPIAPRLARAREPGATCAEPKATTLPGIGAAQVSACTLSANGLGYTVTTVSRGGVVFATLGLSAYQGALDLALRSVLANRVIPESIAFATLGDGDATRFARQRAASADPRLILAEGYRRNNAGSYAESAAYFAALADDLASPAANETAAQATERLDRRHEALVNRALQQSDLGAFDEAARLFAAAEGLPTRDPVQLRLRRNFEAIDRLNQGDVAGVARVIEAAQAPLAAAPVPGDAAVSLDVATAAALNSGTATQLGGLVRQETALSPVERAAILDAQAQALRGIADRLAGQPQAAEATLRAALAAMLRIREGRVTSITRLRAQTLAELGHALEAQGRLPEAEAAFVAAIDLLTRFYPETAALNGARAQYAGYLTRRDRRDEALALYGRVITTTVDNQADLPGIAHQLDPYFALLVADLPAHPERIDDLFLAAQTLVRPGAAATLEQLARALSAGDDVGARLFRQSVSLSRDIERARIALAQLQLAPDVDRATIAAATARLTALGEEKRAAVASLNAYPRYRAIDRQALRLADLRALLRPGEAYFKLTAVGPALYAIYVDQVGATGYRLPIGTRALAERVRTIRQSISTQVNGVQATYPFAIAAARAFYLDLMGPIADRLGAVRHLIVEPDGALLELPVNLLVTDQASVDRYRARRDAGGDEFDFRDVAWLGRDRAISTALSVRAFQAIRTAPTARGDQRYLGFGENAPLAARPIPASAASGFTACAWPLQAWNRPISANELRDAARQLGAPPEAVVTGAAFTDAAIAARADLDRYHILHFATHGLVTPPAPGCPADPALLTSVGGGGSDGLLDFAEIFALRLDADLVILSACDTAAGAGRAATIAAGLTEGGSSALDGLVRAFIGAGGRTVIASHWPAPDQYDATARLFTGMFAAPPGTATAFVLRDAQRRLMDAADTSHPFYWAGFAVVGDGARPLITSTSAAP